MLVPTPPLVPSLSRYRVARGTVSSLWGVEPPRLSPWRAQCAQMLPLGCRKRGWRGHRSFPSWGWGRSHQLNAWGAPAQLCPWQDKPCTGALLWCRQLGNSPWLCPRSNRREKMLLTRLLCHSHQPVTSSPSPFAFLPSLSFFSLPQLDGKPGKQRLCRVGSAHLQGIVELQRPCLVLGVALRQQHLLAGVSILLLTCRAAPCSGLPALGLSSLEERSSGITQLWPSSSWGDVERGFTRGGVAACRAWLPTARE